MSDPIVLGIEVSPSAICLGLVQEDGCILSQNSFTPKNQVSLVESVLSQLSKLLEEASCERERLAGVGISALSHAEQQFFGESLSNALSLPTEVTHIGNAAALAEMRYGMAKGWKDFISVSIDADLQCGIVTDGELVTGEHGLAGGFGHLLIKTKSGRERLVDYISERGIERAAWRLIGERSSNSELKNYSRKDLTAQHIIESAKLGDAIGKEVFQRLGEVLGLKLSDVVHHFSPNAFIFNSTLPDLTELLLPAAKEQLDQNCLAIFRGKAELLSSNLDTKNISVLSAGAIAWEMLDKKAQ